MADRMLTGTKVKASSGRIFPDVIVLPVILGVGAAVVFFLAETARHWMLFAVMSYVGSSFVAAVPIFVGRACVTVANRPG